HSVDRIIVPKQMTNRLPARHIPHDDALVKPARDCQFAIRTECYALDGAVVSDEMQNLVSAFKVPMNHIAICQTKQRALAIGTESDGINYARLFGKAANNLTRI